MENKRNFRISENSDDKLTKKIRKTMFFLLIIILLMTLVFIWIKYEVEGTKGLPFEIEEVLVISTAHGNRIENKNKKVTTDKFEASQFNDVFIKIKEKKDVSLDTGIKKISINNFKIEEKPKKGELLALEPTGDLPQMFSNSTKNYIESSIEYKGAEVDNLEQLETSDTGGTIAFRIENKLGSYNVKKDEVFEYNSKLLKRFVDNVEEIKFILTFDIVIELDNGFKFTTNIKLNKPQEEIFKEDKVVVVEDISHIGFKKI